MTTMSKAAYLSILLPKWRDSYCTYVGLLTDWRNVKISATQEDTAPAIRHKRFCIVRLLHSAVISSIIGGGRRSRCKGCHCCKSNSLRGSIDNACFTSAVSTHHVYSKSKYFNIHVQFRAAQINPHKQTTNIVATPDILQPQSPPRQLRMNLTHLPPSSLPAFAHLNQIHLELKPVITPSSGTGLHFSSTDAAADDSGPLVKIPQDLILCASTVEARAKYDHHLAEVLKAVGEFARSPRGAIIVFLLFSFSTAAGLGVGQRGAWSE